MTAAADPAPERTPMLSVRSLHVRYGAAQALRGIDLDVYAGEVVTVIGGNGAGKSTTLKTVSGVSEMLKHVDGSITFLGKDIVRKPAYRIARMGMAHVPEGRRVFPDSSAEENLMLGAYRRKDSDIASDLEAVYARFPILAERRRQPAGLMSGGEQQMLAIGRGLMAKPTFLLLDEPSLGLAPLVVEQVFAAIRQLKAEGLTILLVEQLATKALAVADRAYILETGSVVMSGSATDLAHDPKVRAAYLGA
ncbi:MAG: transporter related [Actinomycetia bacterium]|nr:transporter related [Actinomycetes bacterium]